MKDRLGPPEDASGTGAEEPDVTTAEDCHAEEDDPEWMILDNPGIV